MKNSARKDFPPRWEKMVGLTESPFGYGKMFFLINRRSWLNLFVASRKDLSIFKQEFHWINHSLFSGYRQFLLSQLLSVVSTLIRLNVQTNILGHSNRDNFSRPWRIFRSYISSLYSVARIEIFPRLFLFAQHPLHLSYQVFFVKMYFWKLVKISHHRRMFNIRQLANWNVN